MANEFKIKNGITIDNSDPANGIVSNLDTATSTDLVTGAAIKAYVDANAGGGSTLSGNWRFSTSTTAGDPSEGRFRLNNATQGSATELYISAINRTGTDSSIVLKNLEVDDQIYLQLTSDSSVYHNCVVTSNAVDNGGWFTIGINVTDSGTSLSNNAITSILFVLSTSASSSPSVGEYGDINAADGAGAWYNTDIHVNESGVNFPGSEVRLSTNDANGVLKLFNAVDETSDSIIELSPSGIFANNTVNGSDPVDAGDFVTKNYADVNYKSASQGQGVPVYLGNEIVSGDNYSLELTPDTTNEVIVDTTVSSSDTPKFIERFVTEDFQADKLNAGIWNFNTYLAVSSSGGTSTVTIRVNKSVAKTGTISTSGTGLTRQFIASDAGTFAAGDANSSILLATLIETPTETFWIDSFTSDTIVTAVTDQSGYVNETDVPFRMHYLLFSVTTDEINSTTPTLYNATTVQPEFAMGETDEIVISYFANTTANSNKTISLYKNGTDNYSHVLTPQIFPHNRLNGLNNGDYIHLTAAEKSDLDDLIAGGVGPGGSMKYAIVKDVKPEGTQGGPALATTWETRDLNTLSTNITGLTLSSNQITLPAGTYLISGSAPAYKVAHNKAILYNVTDSSVSINGSNEYTDPMATTTLRTCIVGVVTIDSTKVFELRHRCAAAYSPNGHGPAVNQGVPEVYSQLEIYKV